MSTLFADVSLSAWLCLFRYVAKMAAVEYEKCATIHTPRFDRFELNHPGPLSTLLSARFELDRPI